MAGPKAVRPGIYMIRNKTNGKVYIGATNDIQTRFKQYLYNYTHRTPSMACKRGIETTIYEEGWDNFEFTILDYGPDYANPDYRAVREIEYIMKYRSIDPEYGYNSTIGGDVRNSTKHLQGLHIPRTSKYLSTFTYDITTGEIELQFFGVHTLANKLRQSKETLRWVVRNGSVVANRYYVFYAITEHRKLTYDYVCECKSIKGFNVGGNSEKARKGLEQYTYTYECVNKVAQEYGF